METIKEIFMRRDDMSAEEADELIEIMKDEVMNGEDPTEVLYEQGLEPDYIFDII